MGRRRLRECKEEEKEDEQVDDDEENADDVGYANMSWISIVFLKLINSSKQPYLLLCT